MFDCVVYLQYAKHLFPLFSTLNHRQYPARSLSALGYSPDPTRRMIAPCDANGIWQPSVASSLPTIPNAQPSAVSGPLTVGTVVPYSCNNDYSPEQNSKMIVTCDTAGNWILDVTCYRSDISSMILKSKSYAPVFDDDRNRLRLMRS
ncbi:hypothetical protein DPMN_114013 [Dreissena polymorpha]|uniref:Sushi domain-containing protein n=1 Tax=Dreissena polymorpha TaxID=45954 RepID=A0A9D4KIM2_DREPO|nr:hypothetical protein DPMN_114013 [Dreissena polymorpha]